MTSIPNLPLKNILCIRADNMGDLLMSSPAIRALKETYNCKITVLSSSVSKLISFYIKEIDDVIIYDLPWVKTNNEPHHEGFYKAVSDLKSRCFDAAFIFTVYSQNPLPAAMLAYLAGIPRRFAYCRENPYDLLTDWIPDKEPYTFIQHQVRRDLNLVASIGAATADERIIISSKENEIEVKAKLSAKGFNWDKPWIILHPGVSEKKREYPEHLWIQAGRELAKSFQLLITGSPSEKNITELLESEIGAGAFSLGGQLNLEEFITLIKSARLVVSVNTGTIHLAAATQTPVIVLYALTNPQHLPWKVRGKALYFNVPTYLRSKNEVIRFVNEKCFFRTHAMVSPKEIVDTVFEVLSNPEYDLFPEMMPELYIKENIR